MKNSIRRTAAMILAVALLLPGLSGATTPGPQADYTDVPADSWAAPYVYAARDAGLMTGTSADGLTFGFDSQILRRDFLVILSRMFGWTLAAPATPSFADVPAGGFYYTYVETALSLGVIDGGGAFEPERPITRGEMAVMLVRALGYGDLAAGAAAYGHGFSDVPEDIDGYITIAVDIGMTNGMTATTFAPGETAKREQAAAMMMRVWDRLNAKIDWLHGFYAFSSYGQRNLINQMNDISLGWSRLRLDSSGVWLNTSATGGNEWTIPSAYEEIANYLAEIGKPANLNVYMDMTLKATLADGTQSPELRELLKSPDHREKAVSRIVAEATRTYAAVNRSPYSGVTIDFEGLRAEDKDNFTAFLALLSQELKARSMVLYVAVQPAVYGETHYDGFDFRAIGEHADKVILMAHDYHPRSLDGLEGTTTWHTRTALTPLSKVYYSLRAITSSETGVADTGKIALAISFSTVGWEIDENGRLKSGKAVTPATGTINERLRQSDATLGWNETYRNSYVTYTTGGSSYYVWYESERSVAEKLKLARLFGINGVSIWRLGQIPNYPGVYDVWQSITVQLDN